MSRILAAMLAGLVLSSPAVAAANSATLLAINGGFLLGNADRCGVSGERIARAGHVIDRMIYAASGDSRDAHAAELRFAAMFLAMADQGRDGRLPRFCRTVRAQFERLERHHRRAGLE